MEEKCILDPTKDCLGLIKARELEHDLEDLRKRNDSSHKEYYDRLAVLERQNAVQNEQYRNIMEKLVSVTENLVELKDGNKELVSTLSPLKHRVDDLEKKYDGIAADVKMIKEKPGKRFDGILDKIIGFFIAAVLTIIAAKIGLQ